MRVLMISKALVVGEYQRKLEELAAIQDVQLTVAVPPYWREATTKLVLERVHTVGYELVVLPMVLNGHYHIHFYRRLAALIDITRPDVIHIDEEQYNLATVQAIRLAHSRHIPAVFFTWQNIDRRYPPPFSWFEQYVFRHAAYAVAGSVDAERVLRAKGYSGGSSIIPQFGVDPEIFRPGDVRDLKSDQPLHVGFVGRLIAAKGCHILIDALATLEKSWRLSVVGTGEAQADLADQARRLGLSDRIAFLGQRPSTEIPALMRTFDILVGPSLTMPNWKEQFGRMFVEAMASGVTVIGSDSGEIPNVIGDAGIIVPEGEVEPLAVALRLLIADDSERHRLGRAGRQRVLEHFTQSAVAAAYFNVYRALL